MEKELLTSNDLASKIGVSTKETESSILTAKELTAFLKVPARWVEKHVQTGRIPGAFKAGRYWRIHRPTLERHMLGGNLLLPGESLGTKGRGNICLKRLPRPSI